MANFLLQIVRRLLQLIIEGIRLVHEHKNTRTQIVLSSRQNSSELACIMEASLFISHLVRIVQEHNYNFKNSRVRKTKRSAAIAIILRLSKIKDEKRSREKVEILFIKRSERSGDSWSGDVAFPGGHLEPKESDRDAVERETMEEIGLDLSEEDCKWIGRLPVRYINGGRGNIAVFPHLYIIKGESRNYAAEKYRINRDEVDYAFWVDVSKIFCDITGITHYSSTSTSCADNSWMNILGSNFKGNSIKFDVVEKYIAPLKDSKDPKSALRNSIRYYLGRLIVSVLSVKYLFFAGYAIPTEWIARLLEEDNEDAKYIKAVKIKQSEIPLYGMTYFVLCDLFVFYCRIEDLTQGENSKALRAVRRKSLENILARNSNIISFDNILLNVLLYWWGRLYQAHGYSIKGSGPELIVEMVAETILAHSQKGESKDENRRSNKAIIALVGALISYILLTIVVMVLLWFISLKIIAIFL